MWTLKSVFFFAFLVITKCKKKKVTQYSTHPSLKFPGKHKHTKKKIVNYCSSFILKTGNKQKTSSYAVLANSEKKYDKHKMILKQREKVCSAKGNSKQKLLFHCFWKCTLVYIAKFSKKFAAATRGRI